MVGVYDETFSVAGCVSDPDRSPLRIDKCRIMRLKLLCPPHVNVATQITESNQFEAPAIQWIKGIEVFV